MADIPVMKELPKSSKLLRHGDKEPPATSKAYKIQQALLDNHMIGLKLKVETSSTATTPEDTATSQKPQYEQNYVTLSPFGPLGVKLFIHGRELFPSKEAADKFKAGTFTGDEWKQLINKSVFAKIKRVFASDTLEQRLIGYTSPRERVALVNAFALRVVMGELKKKAPEMQLPDLSVVATQEQLTQAINGLLRDLRKIDPQTAFPETLTITEDTAVENIASLLKLIEKSGDDAGELIEMRQNLSEESKELIQKQLKDGISHFFDANVAQFLETPELREQAARMKDDVIAYAAQYHYDPEIIAHFCFGIAGGKQNEPLEAIIQYGSEARTNTIVEDLAREVANPYDEHFTQQEKQVAHSIATSVQPRVLQHTMDSKMAFVVADAEDFTVCTDVISLPIKNVLGKFEPLKAHGADAFTDFIILTAPGLNKRRIGWLARHECEHALDLTHLESFQSFYKGNLHEVLLDDRQHLDGIHAMLKHITRKSHPAEIKEMQRLAQLLRLEDADKLSLSPDDIIKLKGRMLEALETMQTRMATVMPRPGDGVPMVYDSNFAQMTEAPAVIEELKCMLGKDFVKEVLPRLYEACRYHRGQHPGMGTAIGASEGVRR